MVKTTRTQIYNAKKNHLNLRLLLCQRVKSSYFCWLYAFSTWIMMSKNVWNTQICSPMCRYVRLLPWYNCDRRRITIYYRPVSDTIAIAGQCYNCDRRTTFDRFSYTHLLFSDSQALVRQGQSFWWAIWKAITQNSTTSFRKSKENPWTLQTKPIGLPLWWASISTIEVWISDFQDQKITVWCLWWNNERLGVCVYTEQ